MANHSTHAQPATLEHPQLDTYASRGVALSRDAAHRVVAALYRDADEMRHRGGGPNMAAADEQAALACAIGRILVNT